MRLQNKIALITGGSRGIGLATAQLFAQEGAQVVIFSRDTKTGEKAAAGISGAHFIAGNVTSSNDCERAVAESLQLHGRLDILVNSAGIIYRSRTVEQTSEKEWFILFMRRLN